MKKSQKSMYNRVMMTCASTVLFTLSVLQVSDALSANQNLQLKRSLLGLGFHRDLTTTLVIPPSIRAFLSMQKCSLLLVETLPSGVYADPYQLNSLRPFGGPEVLFDYPVNVEAPEFMSQPHELYIYLNVSHRSTDAATETTEINVTFPIHARYHRPSPDSTHVTVTILHPSLYTNCSKQEFVNSITAPCDVSNSTLCHWESLTYLSLQSTVPLTLAVPVGQEKHKPLVILITLLVSVEVSALLVKSMWTSKYTEHDKHS